MRRSMRPLLLATAIAALTTGTARAEVSEADREFIDQAAMSGQAEVANGETAAKSENSAIADFGNQMVHEHGAMNQELAALAKQKGAEPPMSPSLTDQAKGAVMSVMPGATFDKQYVSDQLTAHQETLALMEKQASGGDDPDLKALATKAIVAPDWLRAAAPEAWYKRYGHRVEDSRIPQAAAQREVYARAVGEDGFALLDWLGRPEAPEGLGRLPKVEVLRRVWERHFVRGPAELPEGGGSVRLRGKDDPLPSVEPVESPYDPEARFRTRSGTSWTGYVVHLSETCQDDMVNLLTHAMTTVATVHEARCTAAIHQALAGKGLTPGEHLVDAAYVDAELLVRGREELGIDLVGPPRPNPSWQGKVEGGYTIDRFEVDWDEQRMRCPQGKLSSAWSPQVDQAGTPYISVMFRQADCAACLARPLCTRAKHQARHLRLQPRAEYEALKASRARLGTKEGRRRHARRAGIEGTLSQGVRAFGLRRSRYRGLARTRLQHVATAAAINLDRLAAWFRAVPRATTRTSRFAALAA